MGATVDRSTLSIGQRLARDDRGSVCEVLNQHINGLTADAWPVDFKEYNRSVQADLDTTALSAMVELPAKLTEADGRWLRERTAWPAGVVEDRGRVVGILTHAIPDRFLAEIQSVDVASSDSRLTRNFEYLLNGDVRATSIGLSVTDHDRLSLLTDLAGVLHRLHSFGIAVGDLSPKNLLFTMNPSPECFLVQCDVMRLGGAGVLPQAAAMDSNGPSSTEKPTREGDVYKFALLAVRLFAHPHAAAGITPLSVIDAALGDVARDSLDPDPLRRPTLGAWVELLSSALMHAPTAITVTSTPAISRPPVTEMPEYLETPEPVHWPEQADRQSTAAPDRHNLMAGMLVGTVMTVVLVLTAVAVTNANQARNPAADPTGGSSDSSNSAYVASTDTWSDPNTSAPATTASSAPPTAVGSIQLGQSVQDDPRATAVGEMFDTYFSGIDSGNYTSALSVEDPNGALDPGNASEVQQFERGVQSTQDSAITLVSLSLGDTIAAATSAVVTFQSNQAAGYGPADAPDETCTNWTLGYMLTPEAGGGYLIDKVASATDVGC